jgi:spore maturation protein CgeB
MKILVVGNFAIDSFGTHISETCEILGHKVSKFTFVPDTFSYNNYFKYVLKKYFRYFFNTLINFSTFRKFWLRKYYKELRINNPDLIIVTHDFFWPEEIDMSKQICISSKVVLWFPDPISNFGKAYFLDSNYDFYFFKDTYIVNKLRKFTKKNIYYLPECYNRNKHFYSNDLTIDYLSDLSCIGNFHSWRSLCFGGLVDKYDFKFYGVNPPSWMKNSPLKKVFEGYTVYNEKKAEIINKSKINLNNLQYGEIMGQNVRLFEIAGSGGFQLVQYNESLDDLFINGVEIVSYSCEIDLHNKIKYYLENDIEREKIRMASKIRAEKDHTYESRILLLINTVFNGYSGFNSDLLSNK